MNPPLTEYAKIWGTYPIPTSGIPLHKSGLTPLGREVLDTQQVLVRETLENFQRLALNGFTSQELVDLDVLTNRHLADYKLVDRLHPLLTRDNWVTTAAENFRGLSLTPLGSLGSGDWIANNPLIWPHLVQVINLATRLLDELSRNEWFDSFAGTREKVDPKRFWDVDVQAFQLDFMNKFWGQVNRINRPRISAADPRITKMLKSRIRFTFMSRSEPILGLTGGDQVYGATIKGDPRGLIFIALAYEQFAHLLNDQLSAQVWYQHAYFCVSVANSGLGNATREPFYDLETIAETGISAIKSLLGGDFALSQFKGPHIALFLETWPTKHHDPRYGVTCVAFGQRSPGLKEPELPSTKYSYPIPSGYLEDILSESFWEVRVAQYGVDALRPCSSAVSSVTWPEKIRYKRLFGAEEMSALGVLISIIPSPMLTLSPDERRAYDREIQVRRLKACSDIQDNLVRKISKDAERTLQMNTSMDRLALVNKICGDRLARLDDCVGRLIDVHEHSYSISIPLSPGILIAGFNVGTARSELKSFNLGFRRFLIYFQAIIPDPNLQQKWTGYLARLNMIRDQLNERTYIEDLNEIELHEERDFNDASQLLNVDPARCMQLCDGFVNNLGCHPLIRARARVTNGFNPLKALGARRLDLWSATLMLSCLKSLNLNYSQARMDSIELWLGVARAEIAKCNDQLAQQNAFLLSLNSG